MIIIGKRLQLLLVIFSWYFFLVGCGSTLAAMESWVSLGLYSLQKFCGSISWLKAAYVILHDNLRHADQLIFNTICFSAYKLGFTSLQAEQIDFVLEFVKGRDTFAVLPTGFGKVFAMFAYHICLTSYSIKVPVTLLLL